MKKAIILLGPTGVGKTTVSILLARALNTDIISSDSMQIYRHMDIGTAKSSREERQSVRHHMTDIAEPWESFSTGEYIERVRPILENLFTEGKTPLIVGGTGLYIRAMTRGIFQGPSADWDLRTELLRKEESEEGSLYEYLKSLDPVAASKIMPTDARRITRALEVCLKSSQPMSELHQAMTNPLPYEFLKIGLMRDRKELYRMIEERVDAMMAQGLFDEVKRVRAMIEEHRDSKPVGSFSSMQAIGYKEIALHLSGQISLEEAVRLIKKKTKMYAKRQFTWFRKEEGIQWIDLTGIHDPHQILDKVMERINA